MANKSTKRWFENKRIVQRFEVKFSEEARCRRILRFSLPHVFYGYYYHRIHSIQSNQTSPRTKARRQRRKAIKLIFRVLEKRREKKTRTRRRALETKSRLPIANPNTTV